MMCIYNKKEGEYVPVTLPFVKRYYFTVVKMNLSSQTDAYNWFERRKKHFSQSALSKQTN